MTGEEIIRVLDKLIGEVEAVGDSYEDAKRLQNLNALIEVMDWCLDTLLFVQEAMYRKAMMAQLHICLHLMERV